MAIIKGILREELENSLVMKKNFEETLKKLPVGSLCLMPRRGRKYYYLKIRQGKKVKNAYKGKLPESEVKKYMDAKNLRKKYRHSISVLKKQIRYLRGALRGKEPI